MTPRSFAPGIDLGQITSNRLYALCRRRAAICNCANRRDMNQGDSVCVDTHPSPSHEWITLPCLPLHLRTRHLVACFTVKFCTLSKRAAALSVPLLVGVLFCALGQVHAADVTSFGAKCDGASDDTPALQKAFNSVKTGGTLAFPHGETCIISKRLSVHDANNYTVEGNGATIKIKNGTPKGNGPFIELRRNNNVTWRHLIIDGNRDNRPCPASGSGDQSYSYHNVVISQTMDFLFEAVSSNQSCMDGFYVVGASTSGDNPSSYSRRGVFLGVNAIGNRRQGMSIINAYDLEIIGGSYSYTDGDWPMAGIDIEPNRSSAEPGVKNVSIRGVLFEGNKGEAGLFITGVGAPENILVEDSHFKNNAVAGVRIHTKNVTVKRNLFEATDKNPELLRYDGSAMPRVYFGGVSVQNDLGGWVTVANNTFLNMHNHSSGVVYVRGFRVTGTGRVSGNCFQNFKAPAVRNDKPDSYSVFDNREDPVGGCVDPRQEVQSGASLPGDPATPVACHLLDSAKNVPAKFGAAYNLFSEDRELLIRTMCGPVFDAQVHVGDGQPDLRIYRTGLEWTGSSWRAFTFDGGVMAGDYFVGTASANLSKGYEDLRHQNFVAVYMCQKRNDDWKCACRDTACRVPMWSLQAYRMQRTE